MRIGMMIDVYKPHVSGVTNYVALNKKFLEIAGHEVFVFTFGDEDYEDDEPNIIRSPGLPLLDTGYYIGLRYSRQARMLLRTMDIVHIQHPFVSGSLALSFCAPRGIPIIFTNHTRYDLYAQAYLPGVPNVVGETALQTYLPAFCRACNMVIAPSPGMRDVLERFGVEGEIVVVPNGVDLQKFKESIEPLVRSEIGFSDEDTLLIYVGRLGPEKNLPFLLRSVAGAVQAYDQVRLLVIGGGPELDNLQDRVRHMQMEKHIKFMGLVPYDQVPRYLATADAFVTASFTEVHPLSVIEAMAAGLPILGIDSPGVGDTVLDGQTGFLIAQEDLAGFTAKMVRLIVNRDERLQMGEQARIEADKYAIERTTCIMSEKYQNVARQSADRKRGLRARMIRWMDGFRR